MDLVCVVSSWMLKWDDIHKTRALDPCKGRVGGRGTDLNGGQKPPPGWLKENGVTLEDSRERGF